MAARRLISTGTTYEERFGFSRAVVVDDRVFVSGCAPVMRDGRDPPRDAYGQARRSLEIVGQALTEAGGSLADVVRTRVYVTRPEHVEEVGRAHAEAFADVRPANTTVIADLYDPRWLVEIEVEAILRSG